MKKACQRLVDHCSEADWKGKSCAFGTVLHHLLAEKKTSESHKDQYKEFIRRLFRYDQHGALGNFVWTPQSLTEMLAIAR